MEKILNVSVIKKLEPISKNAGEITVCILFFILCKCRELEGQIFFFFSFLFWQFGISIVNMTRNQMELIFIAI